MNAEVNEGSEPVAPGQWMTILGLIVAVLAPLVGFLGGSSTGAVVFINAYLVKNQDKQDPITRERFQRWYRVIAWAMVGSVIGALIVAAMGMSSQLHGDAWNIPVFALEADNLF